MGRMRTTVVAIFSVVVMAARAWAGPVILGGDDLTDHGFRDGLGQNQDGWLYIEKALDNLDSGVTRPGPFTVDIAALGSAGNVACPPACSGGNAGDAVQSAASNNGLTVQFFDGAAAISGFFTSLGTGAVNPRIIWLAGTDASNDLDTAEGAALTANANAIASFVASGGGLMSHGCDDVDECVDAYGWLTQLLPGASAVTGCDSDGAMLTPAGMAAFPGLSNSEIDSNVGPCHNHFEGNLGSLQILANDADALPFIIGGGSGTVIQQRTGAPAVGWLALLLTSVGLLAGGAYRIGRRAMLSARLSS